MQPSASLRNLLHHSIARSIWGGSYAHLNRKLT
jgi:hypothetical protein